MTNYDTPGTCNALAVVAECAFLADGRGFLVLTASSVGCCVGSTGNIDCDPTDGADISDLTALIDDLYISFSPLCCPAEANTDGSVDGNIDISDLTALIDYLYISFTPPAACQ